jgi:hypothetical protein
LSDVFFDDDAEGKGESGSTEGESKKESTTTEGKSFHQPEQELTTLALVEYVPAHRKGRLKIPIHHLTWQHRKEGHPP